MPSKKLIIRYLLQAALILVLVPGMTAIRPGSVRAEETNRLEYRIKAAYLYNFTKFITWPEADAGGADPFSITIIGDDPFGGSLEPLTQKHVRKRPIQIFRQDNHEGVQKMDMLFVASQNPDEIKKVLASVKDQATLTIGESPSFTRNGGMIRFYSEKKKIRFEINTKAIRHKGFKVSSQLLKLARIVDGEAP